MSLFQISSGYFESVCDSSSTIINLIHRLLIINIKIKLNNNLD